MKVLLVQGYLGPNPSDSLVFPLGLSYVATALAQDGHSVRICDPNAHPEGLVQVGRELQEFIPEVVGISLRNIDTTDYLNYRYYYAFLGETIRAIRAVCPRTPLLIGGTGFSTFPERILKDHKDIDLGVYLEGEVTVVELLRNLDRPADVPGVFYRKGAEVLFSGSRAFSSYPDMRWPRRDFLDLAPYLNVERSIGVQSYRGCPLSCTYCNYPALNGAKVRGRSARDVVDEIEHLHREHGVKEIIFADSIFDLRRSFAREICEELIARRLDLRWSAWFETYKFDEEWFLLARQAGCYRFCFSPDGASDRTMKALGKRCREGDVENLLRIAARYPETAFRFTLFCGSAKQDWRDVWMSLKFVFRSHFLLKNSRCLLSWTRVFPNSGLYRDLIDSKAISTDLELLPARADDHRSLFFISPDAPGLATPIMRSAFSAIDWTRRLRKQTGALIGALGYAS